MKSDATVSNEMMIMSWMRMPYATHKMSPKKWIANIGNERPWTEPEDITFMTCGKKEMVVHIPPVKPIKNVVFTMEENNKIYINLLFS